MSADIAGLWNLMSPPEQLGLTFVLVVCLAVGYAAGVFLLETIFGGTASRLIAWLSRRSVNVRIRLPRRPWTQEPEPLPSSLLAFQARQAETERMRAVEREASALRFVMAREQRQRQIAEQVAARGR